MNKPLPPSAESPQTLQTQLRTETDSKSAPAYKPSILLASGQASSRPALAKLLAVPRPPIQTWLRLDNGAFHKAQALRLPPNVGLGFFPP